MTADKNIKHTIPEKPENPFVVPEGYFEGLEERVMNRIRSGDVVKEKPGAAEADLRLGKTERRNIRLSNHDAVKKDPAMKEHPAVKGVSLRPYLTLAASMTGIAIVIYILLQTLVGSGLDEYGYYDMAELEQAGVTHDEAIVFEAYSMDEEHTYSDWDRAAMNYLSSNEVDLLQLIDEN